MYQERRNWSQSRFQTKHDTVNKWLKTFTWKAKMYQERQNWSQSRLRRKQRGCGTHLQSEK